MTPGTSIRQGPTLGYVVLDPEGRRPLKLCAGGVLLLGSVATAFPTLRAARAAAKRTAAWCSASPHRKATDPWCDPEHYRVVRVAGGAKEAK